MKVIMNDNERFIHVCADNNLRWNGTVLEQQRYANQDKDGNWLEYPETKWIPVECI